MRTPICDFLDSYARSEAHRAHMPGHKGRGQLGFEARDITEIRGADSLYEASGIIRESEQNAGRIFGADTFYSAEGSSLSIRAMLYLAMLYAKERSRRPLIASFRNVHKSFVSAAAFLDFDVTWLKSQSGSYLSADFSAASVEKLFEDKDIAPAALYVTSPDYLGNVTELKALAEICHKHGALLLVDNAHGAYLKFLSPSRHPIDCGADMCCDSAHKTLSALTGAGYLHISKNAPPVLKERAKYALSLFGSTSPSYLILASLDALNPCLAGEYPERLAKTVGKIEDCKRALCEKGYSLMGNEALKITVAPKSYGYTGNELADLLRGFNIEPEFSDPDFLVLMLSAESEDKTVEAIRSALLSVEPREPLTDAPPVPVLPKSTLRMREAALSPSEAVPIEKSVGRIIAAANLSCPPAVPIAVMGEIIDEATVSAFKYYGIEEVLVVKRINIL